MAEKVVLITNPGEAARYKMDLFLKNLSVPDDEKYLTICNKAVRTGSEMNSPKYDYCVSLMDGAVKMSQLIGNEEIEKIAYLL